jgi:hypothetical protein
MMSTLLLASYLVAWVLGRGLVGPVRGRGRVAHLPTDDLFLRTELTHAEDHRIVAVEGGVAVSAKEPS